MNSNPHFQGYNIAVVAHQLRAEATLKKAQELLAEKGIRILVLKGPHLGNTVYDSPADRLYGDLDVLVRSVDFESSVNALLENGFQPFAYNTFAPQIQRDFKHWEFRSPLGIVVELHRWLSGHDRYTVDMDGLFARAESFRFGGVDALGLAPEDLLLHLCLHMGTSYFSVIERKHIRDIALLIRKRPIAWPVFLRRTGRAGARAIAYYSLLAAKKQDSASIPDEVMKTLCPMRARRWWIEKHVDAASFPVYRFPEHSMKRIKKGLLFPLMDKPGQWLKFVWRIGVLRIKSRRNTR